MSKKKTLCALFLERVSFKPKKNAIGSIKNDQLHFISYNEYFELVNTIACYLLSIGMTGGKKIAILSETRQEWHLFDMAILSIGCVSVPIYPNYNDDEIKYIMEHAEVSAVIVEDELQLEKILNMLKNFPSLEAVTTIEKVNNEMVLEHQNSHYAFNSYAEVIELGLKYKQERKPNFKSMLQSVDELDIASIVYTSGTTGEPKGAIINHLAFVTMLNNLKEVFNGQVDGSDRTLIFLPLSHVLGRCDSFLILRFGLEAVYAENIAKVVENLNIARPTFMVAVPRIFEKIYASIYEKIEQSPIAKRKLFDWGVHASKLYFKKIDNDLAPSTFEIVQRELAYKLIFKKIYNMFGGNIRFFVSGGAPLAAEIINFLKLSNLSILEGYGLTETVAPCFLNPLYKQVPGTVGIPIGDVQLSFGDDGEILIKSQALFSGYLKNETETNDSFVDGWFKTGDLGKLRGDGYLKITGRKKDIIITSGGKNIAPQKIESMMKLEKFISQFVVIGDQQKYLTGVIGIEKPRFSEQFDEMGIERTARIEDVAKNKHVLELLQQNIDTVNAKLSRFETIKKFIVLPVEVSVENGLLTPSLKVKKKLIMQQYKNEIESMYNES